TKSGKVPGTDLIPYQVIQAGGKCLSRALNILTNLSLQTGLFLSVWKKGQSVILKKPRKPGYCLPTAYRLIVVLSFCLGKFIEAIKAECLKAYAKANHTLMDCHYGGFPWRLTTNALAHPVTWTKEQWSKGKVVGLLFVDVNAAFLKLTIGPSQGSPLSVLHYILYNSHLLTQASNITDTIFLGFIDNVSFITAQQGFNGV
ncbi:hypothetical protein CROQUDRAFT_48107, partial [Cronartium quercuum f. sp. fusiforme G11]